jgi:hypothetical protein
MKDYGPPVKTKEEAYKLIGTQCGPRLKGFRIQPHMIDCGYGLDRFALELGTSSHGEYGVLKEIFERLDIEKGICCEFGAWDGIKYSNTYNLIVDHGWSAVLMELDASRYAELSTNAQAWPGVRTFQALIHYDKERGTLLDDFLDSVEMPTDFDLLSIDIDSCDYQVWDALKRYKPKVVVIEADNLDLDIIQQDGIPHNKLGGSTCFPPMKALGESKGYTLVSYTYNLIFVHNDYVQEVSFNQ